jgi:hypothetical protein
MPIYAVRRQLSGITLEELAEAQKAAIAASDKLSREGVPVRYIRTNFYPADARCTCLFEAPDAESVRRANEAASLPFNKIEEVLDLNPGLADGRGERKR